MTYLLAKMTRQDVNEAAAPCIVEAAREFRDLRIGPRRSFVGPVSDE